MRVAVTQFATSSNTQENLATCIRMINETATCEPNLIVLPELCNTLSWYADHNQAWHEAVSINGDFIKAIAEQAIKHNCYIVLNVTLRGDQSRDHQDGTIKSNIRITSCLFSPQGKLIHQMDKQNLMGHENDFFISTDNVSEVVTTPCGKVGLLNGSDSMSFEASRSLSLNHAQLLCNSVNTFALDQSHLHDQARACENNVFVATANKVGSLIPQNQDVVFSGQDYLPTKYLIGVGQSQITAPNGKVIAKIDNNEEGFVFADIDLAITDNKSRPDGSDFIKQRRPEIYQEQLTSSSQTCQHQVDDKVPATANVAIFATYKSNEQAIEDVHHYIINNVSDIIQLPELFFVADKTITNDEKQLAHIASLSELFISQVSSVLRPFQYVCTSLVIDGQHQAVLINENGVLAKQQQLHFCQRYQWTELADVLNIITIPLEQGNIKLVMLTADDANIPELVDYSASNNIHLLLVPFDIQESCEVDHYLLSQAAQHRICIVAATREKSLDNQLSNTKNKNSRKTDKSTGLIINLTTDPTLLPQWKSREFVGYINQPLVKHQHGKITKAVIHPIAACNKEMATQYIGKN